MSNTLIGSPGVSAPHVDEVLPERHAPTGTIEDRVLAATRGTALGVAIDGLATAVRIGTDRNNGNWPAVNQRKAEWDAVLLDLGFRQARLAEDGQTLPPDEVALFDERIARAKTAFSDAQKTMATDSKALTTARTYYDDAISYVAANMEV